MTRVGSQRHSKKEKKNYILFTYSWPTLYIPVILLRMRLGILLCCLVFSSVIIPTMKHFCPCVFLFSESLLTFQEQIRMSNLSQ